MIIDTAARQRIVREREFRQLADNLKPDLSKLKIDHLRLDQKQDPEMMSLLKKIGDGITVLFNQIKNIKVSLPRSVDVQGGVDIMDMPPVHIQNFKDLKPYFDNVEKATKYLATAITLISSKGSVEQKAPIINFDTKSILNALEDLKNIKPTENKNELNMLRNISEGIGALVERPTFIPPAVTHVNINALIGNVLSTKCQVGLSPALLPPVSLANRRSMIIFNNSSNIVYIGGSGVTVGTGLPVAAGQYSPPIDASAVMLVYAISTGSSDLRVMEVSDEDSGH